MVSMNELCKSILEGDEDILACSVVDLPTGQLLGCHHNVPYFTQAYLDTVAASVVQIFRGQEVQRMESLLSKFRNTSVKDTIEEVFLSSGRVYHFMCALPTKNAAVILVTRSTTSKGMGWLLLRNVVPKIETALP